MQDTKPINSLVESGTKLSTYVGNPLSTPHEYRSVVGALQYVTLTRSNIAFASINLGMNHAILTRWP